MAPRDRALYGRWLGWIKNARKIPVSVMHLAQRFYKTVNDMPAAKGTRRTGLCEGAIYTAFKACGVTRSTRETFNLRHFGCRREGCRGGNVHRDSSTGLSSSAFRYALCDQLILRWGACEMHTPYDRCGWSLVYSWKVSLHSGSMLSGSAERQVWCTGSQ
jgi:hypothetical protein